MSVFGDPSALRRAISATLLPGFVGTTLPAWLERRLRGGLAGVCIFGGNIQSRAQLRELTDSICAANPSAIIAIDEEGGDVTRLYYRTGSPYPGNAVLGRIDDLEYTESVARTVGWELRRVGCNLNFAPDIDINSNDQNPVIGVRSFGSTPDLVARHGAAWIRGLQAAGVAVSAKHFPGHGDTAQDSHLALPVVDLWLDELRERELKPFRSAVDAGANSIMTSHILMPRIDADHPATHSRILLEEVLRRELGFDGVIVSDALDMVGASGELGIPEAAVRALSAGCDLLCIGTDNTDSQLAEIETAVFEGVDAGRLDAVRVSEAAGRVAALAARLANEREMRPVPDILGSDEPDFDTAPIIGAFDVAARAQAWPIDPAAPLTVVEIETVANIAVGVAPWGPFAAVRADPDADASRAFSTAAHFLVTGSSDETDGIDPAGSVLVVGKDIHRHAFARSAVDRLRSSNPAVLVVDMGWPSADRAYADVATFGASRLVGRALLDFLAGLTS